MYYAYSPNSSYHNLIQYFLLPQYEPAQSRVQLIPCLQPHRLHLSCAFSLMAFWRSWTIYQSLIQSNSKHWGCGQRSAYCVWGSSLLPCWLKNHSQTRDFVCIHCFLCDPLPLLLEINLMVLFFLLFFPSLPIKISACFSSASNYRKLSTFKV